MDRPAVTVPVPEPPSCSGSSRERLTSLRIDTHA
jgi:hypothetical protein